MRLHERCFDLVNGTNELYDSCLDSCDAKGSSPYHMGCHPALFLVVLDDGSLAVRCFDCLEGRALEEATEDSLRGMEDDR